MKRFLIINADDFGQDKETNKGILEAIKDGAVTSVSLITNLEGFENALDIIKQNPDIDTGLHLNIYRGKPISQLKYLTGKNGDFLKSIVGIFIKCYKNRELAEKEIYEEFDAQIKKARDKGIKISHLDTDKHTHTIPLIFKIVAELAKKYSIGAIRFPHEPARLCAGPRQLLKLVIMNLYKKRNKKILKSSDLKSPDYFYGVSLSGKNFLKKFKKMIEELKPGASELSCHPSLNKRKGTFLNPMQELKLLASERTKQYILEKNIRLINFADLNKI